MGCSANGLLCETESPKEKEKWEKPVIIVWSSWVDENDGV